MHPRLLLLLSALLLISPAVKAFYLVEPLIIGGDAQNNPPSYIVHLNVVGVTQSGDPTSSILCGGSYVGDGRVLTAAHCLEDTDGFVFQYVEVSFDIPDGDLRNLDEAVTITATEYAEFPGYEFPDRDYAVIFLPEPAPASAEEIQLATELDTERWINDNIEVKTMGWGRTDPNDKNSISDVLQTVSLNLDNNDTCGPENICKIYNESDYIVLAGATNAGKDACQGDSGGPLVRAEAGMSFLVGVTSFGAGCAEDGNSGGYAKVSAASQWIMTVQPPSAGGSAPSKSLTEIATTQRELTGTGSMHPLLILLLLPWVWVVRWRAASSWLLGVVNRSERG